MNNTGPGLLTLFCLAAIPFFGRAENTDSNTARLESIRIDIRELEDSIRGAGDEKVFLIRELEENEKDASRMATKLDQLNYSIAGKVQAIRDLQSQQRERQQELRVQKDSLGRQIRAAYISGRADYLKLLLNQQDPQRIGRVLAYYDYHNRQRLAGISDTQDRIRETAMLENRIRVENAALIELKQQHEAQLALLQNSREMRLAIIAKLDQYISARGEELERLHVQERELEKLIESIGDTGADPIGFFEDIAPFDTLRGTLEWPIRGNILHSFGSPKKGGDLNWQGILIEAQAGTEVKAISTGKVVFADWFKNLGLLLIIEHGDGYMSLYGHNQSLSKKQGDWVLPGEPVAVVGDSGGQARSGLYFEIRHRGKPLNPVRWCKK